MTTPRFPLAGVIGDPVHHSKSPRLHGHWLARYDLPGAYLPLPVSAPDLAIVLSTLPKMGFVGVNVTIPHKEAALTLATDVTDRARRIGAANTLTFLPSGGVQADNTDGYGYLASLGQQAPEFTPKDSTALVLGAGGAARGVIAALIDAGVAKVWIANRTRAKAEDLAAFFGPPASILGWGDVDDRLADAHLLVNTTALGMAGNDDLPFTFNGLSKSTTVSDIVYTPLETPLLHRAHAIGCATVDGLGMLLHQAAPGFECWFGRKPTVDRSLRDAVLG